MADYFIDSAAAGAADGSTWANAYTTLVAAVSGKSANDRFIVANTHNETGALSITFPSNSVVLSSTVSGTADINYSRAVSRQFDATVNNQDFTFIGNNSVFVGLFLSAGRTIYPANVMAIDCTLEIGSIGGANSGAGAPLITPQGTSGSLFLLNCDVDNRSTSSNAYILTPGNRGFLRMVGGSVSSARTSELASHVAFTLPSDGSLIVEDVDCSGFQMSTLVDNITSAAAIVILKNIRTNALTTSVFKNSGGGDIGQYCIAEGVGSGTTPSLRDYVTDLGGALTDTGTYVTAGAVNQSIDFTTSSNANTFFVPLYHKLGGIYADWSTAKTVTIEFAQDGTTTGLDDAEIYAEIRYPDGSSADLLIDSNKAADNVTTSTRTTSSTTWTGLSGTNARQKMTITTTGTGQAGVGFVYIGLTKPSTTVFVDVNITVT